MLQDKALLIRISLSRFTPYKADRHLSEATARAYDADFGSVRVMKKLISGPEYKLIERKDSEIRKYIYYHTRPWMDEGWRILPTETYLDVSGKIAELFDDRERLVADFVAEWPKIKAATASALGGAYLDSDFPEDVEPKFRAEIAFMPIPRIGDFRLDGVSADDVVRMEAEMMTRIEEQFKSTDLWKRVYDAVSHISERLHAYDTDIDGKVVNRFHDTLIGNLRDLVDILPKLNISDDESLNDMHKRLQQELCLYDPQELRENVVVREDVAAAADRILQEVAGWIR